MSCGCDTMTFRKAIPSETIEKGDLLMLDIESGYIKRAVLEKPYEQSVNTKLVVGVCVGSDNESAFIKKIDGGSSLFTNRKTLNGGTSESIQTIIVYGGDSTLGTREIVQVAYLGEVCVNIYGRTRIGDRLCISRKPGKAKSIDELDDFGEGMRSIGKVISFLNKEKTQAKVLLNIE